MLITVIVHSNVNRVYEFTETTHGAECFGEAMAFAAHQAERAFVSKVTIGTQSGAFTLTHEAF